MAESDIHSTAIVHPEAVIGSGTIIGPYSIIGPQVRLGLGTKVGAHVVLDGRTTFGDDNTIFSFAAVGGIPQDLKYRGELSELIIGSKNIVREYVTLQPGTEGGGMVTRIGDSNLFMANAHVGHDAIIGNHNIFANSSALAGHVTVGNFVTVGGLSAIHQFVRLGDYSILGGGSMVSQDIPPFVLAHGDHAELVGLNAIGIKRHGFSAEDMRVLKAVFRALFIVQRGTKEERIKAAASVASGNAAAESLIAFVAAQSVRGIARTRRVKTDDPEE